MCNKTEKMSGNITPKQLLVVYMYYKRKEAESYPNLDYFQKSEIWFAF